MDGLSLVHIHNHPICKVCCHDEVMLDNKRSLFRVEYKSLNLRFSVGTNPARKSSLSSTLKIVIISTSLVLSVMVGVLIFCFLKSKKKLPLLNSLGNSLLQVSYQTLFQATDGFSDDNLLGVGSYGSVFKGVLEEDRKIVAVKVLNLSKNGAVKSFLAECEALKNIRHRNLVKVVTACSGFDLQGNDFKALVYEFMPNGSLHDWLHLNPNEGEARKLGLVQRLDIAIDVACAVDYLHQHCGAVPIIHCDIKPSNVLLDEDLVGRVGDFGLARFVSRATDSSSTHGGSSSLIRGTIGYTAPEYGFGGGATTYGDVYSFGILVLEVFTGKRPTDGMLRDGFGIHSFVKNCSVDDVTDIVDPWLSQEMETAMRFSNDHHRIRQCLFEALNVGVGCSVESAKERMSISDAISKLQSIRNDIVSENADERRRV